MCFSCRFLKKQNIYMHVTSWYQTVCKCKVLSPTALIQHCISKVWKEHPFTPSQISPQGKRQQDCDEEIQVVHWHWAGRWSVCCGHDGEITVCHGVGCPWEPQQNHWPWLYHYGCVCVWGGGGVCVCACVCLCVCVVCMRGCLLDVSGERANECEAGGERRGPGESVQINTQLTYHTSLALCLRSLLSWRLGCRGGGGGHDRRVWTILSQDEWWIYSSVR